MKQSKLQSSKSARARAKKGPPPNLEASEDEAVLVGKRGDRSTPSVAKKVERQVQTESGGKRHRGQPNPNEPEGHNDI